ncbi:SDR family NAD(P)-dependent oxidoreductase [Parachitinimonas caeni]|uniref:SDR family NAD(P)-dependent oxidoreductase n=1 Tax=Parachitinimonas caeni TaxID=3031301 RepID=UPI0027E4E01E|nr:SDR family NAD(P)-dependent oxidoreductase [Parachitinimonas caeni]
MLITGCSTGIGEYVAQALAQEGWQVFASARQMADVERLRAQGLNALWLDVDSTESITQAVEQVLTATQGRLYALFNNAGFGQPGAVEDLPRVALREQFETNLFGAIELTNQLLPAMRRNGTGRLLFNSSVLGFAAMPYRGAYNASKFAMEGMVDTLRLELRGTGIWPVLIEPGPITSRFRANAEARFHRHINAEASAHYDVYAAMQARLAKPGPASPFTLGPEAVQAVVRRALLAHKPAARYRVTTPTHLFAWAKRLLPTALLDWLLIAGAGEEARKLR